MASPEPPPQTYLPLPPSPMTVERRVVPLRDVRLPWNACLLTALAAAVAFTMTNAPGAVGRWQVLASLAPWVPWVAADGALAGLGCALLDRVRPRWRRSERWALGMGLAWLVRLAQVRALLLNSFATSQSPLLWTLASGVAVSGAAGALVGAYLAAAAEARPRSHATLLLAGLCVGLIPTVGHAVAMSLRSALGLSGPGAGMGYWLQVLLGNCTYTALLGLALGDRLWAAWREQADEEAVDGA